MTDERTVEESAVADTDPMFPEDQPWRKGLDDFSEKNLHELKNYIEMYEPLEVIPVKQARVLLVGPIGAGKSSMFNTINSIYRGHVTAQAAAGQDPGSLTTRYRTYEARSGRRGQPMNFRLCDTMGLEDGDQGLDIKDFYYILDGYVPDSFEFKVGQRLADVVDLKKGVELKDKIHVLAIVINAMDVDYMTDGTVEKLREIRKNALKRAIPVMLVLTHVDKVCTVVEADITRVYHSRAVWRSVEKAGQIVGMPTSQVIPVKNYNRATELDRGVDILALFALRQMIRLADGFFDEQMSKLGITLPKPAGDAIREEPPKEKTQTEKDANGPKTAARESPEMDVKTETPLPSGQVALNSFSAGWAETPLPSGWEMMTNAKGEVKFIHEESGRMTKERPEPKASGAEMDVKTETPLPSGWEMMTNAKGEVKFIHEESGRMTKERPEPKASGPELGAKTETPLPPGWEMMTNAKGEVKYVHEESGTITKERPEPTASSEEMDVKTETPLPPGWEMMTNAKGEVKYVHEELGTITKERPTASSGEMDVKTENPLPTGWEMVTTAKGEVKFIHEASGAIRSERPEPTVSGAVKTEPPLPSGWEQMTTTKGVVMYIHESGTATKERPIAIENRWKSASDSEGRVYYIDTTTNASQWERPPGDMNLMQSYVSELMEKQQE